MDMKSLKAHISDLFSSTGSHRRRFSLKHCTPPQEYNAVSGFELPNLSLPSLIVGYREWLPFKEEIQLLIHNSTCLSDIQKFYCLRSALIGDVSRQVIHSLKLTAAYHTVACGRLTGSWVTFIMHLISLKCDIVTEEKWKANSQILCQQLRKSQVFYNRNVRFQKWLLLNTGGK
jgi:hypothetical protein